MEKNEVLLDNQRHIIDLREMQEHDIASGESVATFRQSVSLQLMDKKEPKSAFL